jgi:hypothetical protein
MRADNRDAVNHLVIDAVETGVAWLLIKQVGIRPLGGPTNLLQPG